MSALLKEKSCTLLGSASGVDLHTNQANTIYTTPSGKVTRIMFAVIRDYTASLAGGSSFTITGLRSAFSLNSITTANTGYVVIRAADLTESTEIAASTAVVLTVTDGADASVTGTVDIFGYQT